VLGYVLLFIAGIIILKAVCGAPGRFAFAMAGDEDMKIVTGGFHGFHKDEELENAEAEVEANAYMRHKNNGNIEKARALGRQFAAELCGLAKTISEPQSCDDALMRLHNKLLLFYYVINRVISDLSLNSILAQTTLNVFYAELESTAPELYGHVRDMAAFSFYILCERSETCNEYEIGKVYARLCGGKDQISVSREGVRLYREYYSVCSGLYEQEEYRMV